MTEQPEGYTPRYSHWRIAEEDDQLHGSKWIRDLGLTPKSKGGMTICKLIDATGKVAAIGLASCSRLDNYNRTIGRDIARGRAFKSLTV